MASAVQLFADAAIDPPVGGSPPPEAVEFFESRVRPVLVERCQKCHGPKKQSSGLRLDSRDGVLKGGDNGPAVVPGKPDESVLFQAVSGAHRELKMPPDGKLPEQAVASLRQWVSLGVPWPDAARSRRPPAAKRAGNPAMARVTGRFSRCAG